MLQPTLASVARDSLVRLSTQNVMAHHGLQFTLQVVRLHIEGLFLACLVCALPHSCAGSLSWHLRPGSSKNDATCMQHQQLSRYWYVIRCGLPAWNRRHWIFDWRRPPEEHEQLPQAPFSPQLELDSDLHSLCHAWYAAVGLGSFYRSRVATVVSRKSDKPCTRTITDSSDAELAHQPL